LPGQFLLHGSKGFSLKTKNGKKPLLSEVKAGWAQLEQAPTACG
jgi:hypothetical protein